MPSPLRSIICLRRTKEFHLSNSQLLSWRDQSSIDGLFFEWYQSYNNSLFPVVEDVGIMHEFNTISYSTGFLHVRLLHLLLFQELLNSLSTFFAFFQPLNLMLFPHAKSSFITIWILKGQIREQIPLLHFFNCENALNSWVPLWYMIQI